MSTFILIIDILGVALSLLCLVFSLVANKKNYDDLKNSQEVVVPYKWLFSKTIKEIEIGRAHSNKIIVDSPLVSKEHAVIQLMRDNYFIKDLNSLNGTKLNDELLNKGGNRRLRNGDLLDIANYQYRINLHQNQISIELINID